MKKSLGVVSGVTTGVEAPENVATLWYDRSTSPYVLRWYNANLQVWEELIKGVTAAENVGSGSGQIFKQVENKALELRSLKVVSDDISMHLDATGETLLFDLKEYLIASDTYVELSARGWSTDAVIIHSNVDWFVELPSDFVNDDWVSVTYSMAASGWDGFLKFVSLKENYTGQARMVVVTIWGYVDTGAGPMYPKQRVDIEIKCEQPSD
jgi:hypothetical protein